ncbi:MAG: polysaccharide deacetylase family protein [Candidatus Krumholzibacteria bacterium]|nr:polysaccharide deacetylase family protein [Candidatus Krumholzibacteria bacterium]
MGRFPILMYHRVSSPRCPVPGGDREEARYAVSLDGFARQLDAVAAAGCRGVSMETAHARLAAGEAVPRGWVVFTFDDGNRSDYEHARELLSERGFGATFYVCGNRVGADGGLSEAMIRELRADGFHIGAHGMTHRFLTALAAAEEERELEESRDRLAAILGAPVDHFAPPGGRYSGRTLSALRRLGYRAVATSDFGFNPDAGARFVYRRIPVVESTGPERFRRILTRDAMALAPLYARAGLLRAARGLLGEARYRRLRAMGTE